MPIKRLFAGIVIRLLGVEGHDPQRGYIRSSDLDALRRQGADQRAIRLLEEGLIMAAEIQDRSNTGYFIKGIAAVALRRTASTRAVRLLGAAHEMLDRAAVPRVRHATQTTLYDQLVNQAQVALGHSVFKEARAEGRLLTVEEAQSEACAIADCIAPLIDEGKNGCEE